MPEEGHYFVNILNRGSTVDWFVFTHWIETKSRKPAIETRKASIIDADRITNLMKSAQLPLETVRTESHLYAYLVEGGAALISEGIVKMHLPGLLDPIDCIADSDIGFVSVSSDTSITYKAPSPKLRMAVLKRDNYSCRICGRNCHDFEDVQLHVHHVTPFKNGGPTHEQNLLTLCHTCHNGLEPHNEPRLRKFLKSRISIDGIVDLDYRCRVQSNLVLRSAGVIPKSSAKLKKA